MGEKSQSNFTNSSMAAADNNNLPSLDDFLIETELKIADSRKMLFVDSLTPELIPP